MDSSRILSPLYIQEDRARGSMHMDNDDVLNRKTCFRQSF